MPANLKNQSSRPARKGAGSRTAGRSAPAAAHSRRKFFVFISLVGVLSFTSVLLLALAPAPLTQDSADSLFALDAPESLDVIFQTSAPRRDNRWGYIFIHHSRTASGNAVTVSERNAGLADHFVIGNGSGAIDGEIQIGYRWAQQLPAGRVAGVDRIDPSCISICLVGDFDHAQPTQTQRLRLTQLVNALQSRLQIPGARVLLADAPGTAGSAGRKFPAAAFRQQLLP